MDKYQAIEKLEGYIQALRQLPDDVCVLAASLDFSPKCSYILLSSIGGHPTDCEYKDFTDMSGDQLRTVDINGVNVQWYVAHKED